MEPRIETVQPFTVSGISVRTNNRDEADPAQGKLGALWKRFGEEGLEEHTENKVPASKVYGVYSDYESDANGEYTVTAGVTVTAATANRSSVNVKSGQYLVFEVNGEMPQALLAGWEAVWSYFGSGAKYQRLFMTDFEEHRSPTEAAIFVSVRSARLS